jgi:hypothetical protein
MRIWLLVLGTLAVMTMPGLTAIAPAAPAPSVAPKSWQLQFEFEDPRRLVIQLPGESKPRVYWYMLYTVTNNSNRDVQFMPRFEIVTDNLQVLETDVTADPAVFAAIKKIHTKDRPFLLEPLEVLGKLLQGEDNAKDSVAIWQDFTGSDARQFTIFVSGLSGEMVILPNPTYDSTKPEFILKDLPGGIKTKVMVNPKRFVLHKTLSISYRLPGDDDARKQADPIRQNVEWLMR